MAYETLSEGENNHLMHWSRWGSTGYPVQKMGRKWFWVEAYGVKGCPSPFKTKREAFEAYETYIHTLIERAGLEAQAKALAALNMRNLPVRKVSIVNIEHPEWGSFGVWEDEGGSYVIGNSRGSRMLDKWEAENFWKVRPNEMS